MSKLCFVFSWSDTSKRTWSGTPRGLFDALSSRIQLKELNVASKESSRLRVLKTILKPAHDYDYARKIIDDDSKSDGENPYFVFGEYNSSVVGRTFCYQDLSIDYLIREIYNKQSYYSQLPILKKLIMLHILKAKRSKASAFYNACGGIFTMSEWLKNDLVNNFGISEEKVHHVGGGCSIDASRIDGASRVGNKFLFVGKNWDRKNGDLVVDAFNKLIECYPDLDLQLYIVGPKSMPSSIVGKRNVHFLGRLAYEELTKVYNSCDYFVMPSKFEAYGLVFAEALIFGLPCIGKNCCAMPEFIENDKNGYLINTDDVDELLGAMKKILDNRKILTECVQVNRDTYIDKYSWASVADRIIEVLTKEGFVFETN